MTAKNNLPLLMKYFSLTVRSLRTQEIGDVLCAVADQAVTALRGDILGEICMVLQSLPLPRNYESIITYYTAIRIGINNPSKAKPLLTSIIDCESPLFSARAMLQLGKIELREGHYYQGQQLLLDATRLNTRGCVSDPVITNSVQLITAILQSLQGDHDWSLRTLRQGLTYAWQVGKSYPAQWGNYLNSYSVELMETGELEKALNISSSILETPFAASYDGWLHTRAEIIAKKQQRASHSKISVPELPVENKILHPDFNQADGIPHILSDKAPARLLDFETLKIEMAKLKRKKESELELERDAIVTEIMRRITDDELTEEQLDQILAILREGNEGAEQH